MNVSLTLPRTSNGNGELMLSVLSSTYVRLLTVLLIVIGLAARLGPFIDPDGRLYWQYMTEDGYLMQTIARNMAIGLGMTTAEGTIATNGVQPLATVIFTGLHWLAGGSKLAGVVLVSLISVFFSVSAAYFLYRVGALVLRPLSYGEQLSKVAATLWFAAPLIVPISMNGLETSLYWSALLGTFWYFLALAVRAEPWRWTQRLTLGVLLGLTFLARNDAVFFIAAVLLVHLLTNAAEKVGASAIARRFVDCLSAGLTSILVASPWLFYNYRLFGSIVPISGTAQSYATELGSNLSLIPAKLFEAGTLFLPLPERFESMLPTILVALAFVACVFVIFWNTLAKADPIARRFILVVGGMVLGIGGYYGIAFGAPHFLARYLSILSPCLWLATALATASVLTMVLRTRTVLTIGFTALIAGMTLIAAGIAGSAFARGFSPGTAHMHKQVVEWVSANVPEDTWVGAPQTGTLGYFHDKTINLDGKVNPYALRVLLEEGHILNYVVESQIDYIADWVGMADWIDRSDLSRSFVEQFELVLKDEQRNLAVLKRVRLKSQ
jgi:hypothetical protein